MRSGFGKNFKISIWGGSHEPAVGVDISGLPEGTVIDMDEMCAFLKRRAPGNSPFATKRREPDIPVPTSGLAPSGDSKLITVSDTVSFRIDNTDTRSSDYKALRSIPRPGHADYTARMRYGDSLNMAGGGPFSARMTAPLCIAGSIALQLLSKRGIDIGAHVFSIEDVYDTPFDPVDIPKELLARLRKETLPTISDEAGKLMSEAIIKARDELDSVGGIVEACATGLPAGIGGAMYDGVESVLAPVLFGIPAVKGVEFGAGFSAAALRGSVNNDPFFYEGDEVRTRTNNHGGILGGITSGMPLITRIAFKPTPSIAREQDSVDLDKKENARLAVKGRHDPCVAVRAVPVVEAALAAGLLDCLMEV